MIVSAQLHFNICKEIRVKLDKHWYDHVPKWVQTSNEGKDTILWNQRVWIGRNIPNYKPDIIVRDNEEGTKLKLNSVALVRERTIPTERPPPVGEVSANFCG